MMAHEMDADIMDHEMHHDMMMMEPDGGELADALAGEVMQQQLNPSMMMNPVVLHTPGELAPPANWESAFWPKVREMFRDDNGATLGQQGWDAVGPDVLEAFKNAIREASAFQRLGLTSRFKVKPPQWTSPTSVQLQTDIPNPLIPADVRAFSMFPCNLCVDIHQDGRVEMR